MNDLGLPPVLLLSNSSKISVLPERDDSPIKPICQSFHLHSYLQKYREFYNENLLKQILGIKCRPVGALVGLSVGPSYTWE